MPCASTDRPDAGSRRSTRDSLRTGRAYSRDLRSVSVSTPGSRTPVWRLPPMEWIRAHWTPGQPDVAPTRVLVAGCGTGAEAFAHSRRFPNAEIVAVDFSARALALAREYQQRERYRRNVRFVMADLSAPGLDRLTGGDFNLVSCHGVVSYVPRAGRALQNVAGCLAADGALVLGVNGVGHVSAGMRAALPLFGFDVARFTEGPAVREALALFDALLGHTRRSDRIASRPADYVASDIFGALNQSLPLPAWVRTARAAGLHLQNSWSAHRTLRLAVEQGYVSGSCRARALRVCELSIACGRLHFTCCCSHGGHSSILPGAHRRHFGTGVRS